MTIILGLFFVVFAAIIGGFLAKLLKIPVLVGYIIGGIIIGAILPQSLKEVSVLAQIGLILLLFSIGVEISFDRFSRFFGVAVFGGLIQVILVTFLGFLTLRAFGVAVNPSLVLAFGFSISSTAVLVKILGERGESDTIHGGIMFSWSLVQDLLVIPVMVLLPALSGAASGGIVISILFSLAKAILIVAGVVILGKKLIPYLIHHLAETNSRELLLLASIALALGTAAITSFFGISPTLGAFLAGVVISESQEHHAVFAETRPLRDLFVALFFVTLGFLVTPSVVISHFGMIILLTIIILLLKAIVVFAISAAFGYKGRTGIATSFGLAQVGEFAFVIFSSALNLKILNLTETSIGISVTLLSLIIAPILFNSVVPFWRKMKASSKSFFSNKLFSAGEAREMLKPELKDHIIICGYGRVGSWVGKVLQDYEIPFVVVDYNQKIVQELKDEGVTVVYGDPTEPEVLDAVGVRGAKAIILAIPDRVAQETLITYVQTVAPEVKIISRAHQNEDWEKLKTLRVNKIVQPEFEAAVEIVRSVLISKGKNREEISEVIRSLRVSHSK